jgi:hypothetical protein
MSFGLTGGSVDMVEIGPEPLEGTLLPEAAL